MKTWSTIIYAVCPIDGIAKEYDGPHIKAPSKKLALEYCQNNGLGYCHIGDEVICVIPCNLNSFEPDWDKKQDFETPQLN